MIYFNIKKISIFRSIKIIIEIRFEFFRKIYEKIVREKIKYLIIKKIKLQILLGDSPINQTINANPTSLTNFNNSINNITTLGIKVIAISVIFI